MFYIDTDVRKFDFRVGRNKTRNKQQPMERSHAHMETHVFNEPGVSPNHCHSCYGLYPHHAGQMHSLGQRTVVQQPRTVDRLWYFTLFAHTHSPRPQLTSLGAWGLEKI